LHEIRPGKKRIRPRVFAVKREFGKEEIGRWAGVEPEVARPGMKVPDREFHHRQNVADAGSLSGCNGGIRAWRGLAGTRKNPEI